MIPLTIRIPFKTPTINHLHGHTMRGAFYLKPEAKRLKKEIKDLIKPMPQLNGQKLSVEVEVHENWFCKNGSVKRKDIANREKFIIDSVFDALEVDDKFIFEHTMRKAQSIKEFAVIKIRAL